MRLGWLNVALGLSAVAIARPAHAAPEVELAWSAPPNCPSANEVRAELADAMGGASPARSVRAHARVAASADAWSVELATEIDGRQRTRSLHASSCTEAASAVATVLALDAGDASPQPAPRVEAPTPSPRVEATPPPAPPRSEDALGRFGAGVDLAASSGASGAQAFGVGGHFAWLRGRARVEIDARWFFPSRVERAGDLVGYFDLALAGVAGCYALLASRTLALSPCLGTEIGRLHASGASRALLTSVDQASLWAAGRAGALSEWKLGRVHLQVRLDAVVALLPHRYSIDEIGAVYQPAAVSGRATLGGEVHFP